MWFKIPQFIANTCFAIHRTYYKQQLESVYNSRNSPSWFDHRIDLYYCWPHNLFWLERGVFPRRYMTEGCRVLDLFCGDGFFSKYFYATIAGHIDAVDKDPSAIAHAVRHHSHEKITYVVCDATTQELPHSQYDLIVWFEGIEHLHASEYQSVMHRIKRSLHPQGMIIGSTPLVEPEQYGKGNWEHYHEFTSTEELAEFLRQDFSQVDIYTTIYPVFGGGKRHTAYFLLQNPL